MSAVPAGRITRQQLANIVGALRAYAAPSSDDCPNPVVGTAPAPDGGTVRVYRDGMIDAIDGSFYSVSPGFRDVDELCDWIEQGWEQMDRGPLEEIDDPQPACSCTYGAALRHGGGTTWEIMKYDAACPDHGSELECDGHPAVDVGRYDGPIGEVVYCDGSCKVSR